ncbi:MAG: aldehyde dehydrogenase (NADP(+)) [Actinomycetes bacterium]
MATQSVDPRTGLAFGPEIADTTLAELVAVTAAAAGVAGTWRRTSGAERAFVLRTVADALDSSAETLVPLADHESGLGLPRLTGELARTTFQLRQYAELLESGEQLEVMIEPVDARPVPVGHPDLRRMLVGLGPVAVYGASNFPFAFGVLGVDTAAALAAGCPVVAKAHPAHPQTCEAITVVVHAALASAGVPRELFSLVRGFAVGRELVRDPHIKAGAFTGSYAGGRALFDLAVGRPDPIPFYGELGSVNPVVVTPGAATRGADLVIEYLDSLTLGTGQFCTNPSLFIVPSAAGLLPLIEAGARERAAGVLLHGGVADLLNRNLEMLSVIPSVRTVVEPRIYGPGFQTTVGILSIAAIDALRHPEVVRTECFGPVGLVVEYDDAEQLRALLAILEGALVATLHGTESEELSAELVVTLTDLAGRVVWNGWPTGVAVNRAQQHGGPHPSTTNALFTSVGPTAIRRFQRPVAFQSLPQAFLPPELRD